MTELSTPNGRPVYSVRELRDHVQRIPVLSGDPDQFTVTPWRDIGKELVSSNPTFGLFIYHEATPPVEVVRKAVEDLVANARKLIDQGSMIWESTRDRSRISDVSRDLARYVGLTSEQAPWLDTSILDIGRTKACFACGETIRAVADKCKHCGEIQDRKRYFEKIGIPDPLLAGSSPQLAAVSGGKKF